MRPPLADRLRTATHDAHQVVDRAVALTSPIVENQDLIRTYCLLYPMCVAIERASPPTLPWGARLPRADWLRSDLARLGSDSPDTDETFELSDDIDGHLGWHYVIEGSAIGSAYLTRHLATVRPDLPADHYFARNRGAGARWRDFLRALTKAPPSTHDAIVRSACHVFEQLAKRAEQIEEARFEVRTRSGPRQGVRATSNRPS